MTETISLEDIEERIRTRSKLEKFKIRIKVMLRNIFDIKYHMRRIKYFCQRGKRGWADCDWWGMDYYLVSIILPMLKELKAKTHGYPGCKGAKTPEEWDKKLDEMIEAFEAADRILEDDYYKEVSGDSLEAIRNASHEEIKKWGELCEADCKIFKKKVKVFIKFFFALWD